MMDMKIIGCTDMHCNVAAVKRIAKLAQQKKVDCIVCCGDISIFGDGLDYMVKKLAHIGKPVFVVPGNHDDEAVLKKLCSYYPNMHFIHKKIQSFMGYHFVGFEADGFSGQDKEFRQWIKKKAKKLRTLKNIILVTHAPPYGTKGDTLMGEHCGNKDIKAFLKTHNNIVAHFYGHFHETAGTIERVNKAKVINSGSKGLFIEL